MDPSPNNQDSPEAANQTEALPSLTTLDAADTNSSAAPASKRPWSQVVERARSFGLYAAIVPVGLVLVAAGFYFFKLSKHPATAGLPSQTLSASQLQQLSAGSVSFDQSAQNLTFHSPVTFNRGIQVSGATTLSNLTVSGVLNPNSISVKQNFQVSGSSLLQGDVTTKQLSVGGNLTVNGISTFTGNLNVNGNGAFAGTLSASSLNVKTATIGGLTFGHIVTTGSTPTATPNAGAGGGSVSISGNDTSGTITITTGPSTPSQGDLVTITFRSPYSSTPHAVVTPLGIDTATNISSIGGIFYDSTSTTQLIIGVSKLKLGIAGVSYTFNYLVAQ